MFKIVFCVTLCLYVFNEVSGRPSSPTDLTEGELLNKFAVFLHNDKELSQAVQKEFNSHTASREKRQTELDDMNSNLDEAPEDNQKGFFDRAAKFMMEVLQRFLKWVNTD